MNAAIALLALTAMTQVQEKSNQPFQLELKLEQEFQSTLTLSFEEPAEDFTLTTKEQWNSLVIGIDPGQYLIEHKVTPTYLTMDGVERAITGGQASKIVERRGAKEGLVEYEGTVIDPKVNAQIATLLAVPLSGHSPDSKQFLERYSQRKVESNGGFSFSGKVLEFDEKIIKLECQWEIQDEPPVNATGTTTLDIKTGWPLRIELKLENARVPGGEGEPMSGRLLWISKPVKT